MQRQSGFTLIEVMIVVVIVAILAAVAYPAYTEYIRKARRSDAMNALAEIRLEQEKWRANNTTFASAVASLGLDSASPDGYYTVSITAASGTDFTAQAVPTGAQTGDDCGTYVVKRAGPDYSGTADADCWSR